MKDEWWRGDQSTINKELHEVAPIMLHTWWFKKAFSHWFSHALGGPSPDLLLLPFSWSMLHISAIFYRFFILFLFHFYTHLFVIIVDERCRHVNDYRIIETLASSGGVRKDRWRWWRLSPFFPCCLSLSSPSPWLDVRRSSAVSQLLKISSSSSSLLFFSSFISRFERKHPKLII